MQAAEAARRAQVSLKRVRHYTATGLLGRGRDRAPDGYDERDVAVLAFIRQGRALGFSVGELRTLLELWQDRERSSEELARLAEAHAARVEQRIAALQVMHAGLRALAEGCRRGERDECPIPNLEGGTSHEQQQVRVRKDGQPRL